MKPTIGIIGMGFVGKATGLLFANSKVLCYDKEPSLCIPHGLTLERMVDECDMIFVSVPTPMNKDTGSCCTSIIESVKGDLDKVIEFRETVKGTSKNKKPIIVLRSTVPPGTCERLGWVFMPEFLTEANWRNDTINASKLYFGFPESANCDYDYDCYNVEQIKDKIKWFVTIGTPTVKGTVRECIFGTSTGMEMFKIFANSFLAMKVGFCNEFYRYTQTLLSDKNSTDSNISNPLYDELCGLLSNDVRIGTSHMKVPGPDGKFGFGGTCFPKDINSLFYEMNLRGVSAPITSAVIKRNEEIDRPEKDWASDLGRAVI